MLSFPWGNLGALGGYRALPWVWGVLRRCHSPQLLTSTAEVCRGDLGDVERLNQPPISGVGVSPAVTHQWGGGLGVILGARRAQAGARGSAPVAVGQAEQQQVGAGEGSLQDAAVWGKSVPGELRAGGDPHTVGQR